MAPGGTASAALGAPGARTPGPASAGPGRRVGVPTPFRLRRRPRRVSTPGARRGTGRARGHRTSRAPGASPVSLPPVYGHRYYAHSPTRPQRPEQLSPRPRPSTGPGAHPAPLPPARPRHPGEAQAPPRPPPTPEPARYPVIPSPCPKRTRRPPLPSDHGSRRNPGHPHPVTVARPEPTPTWTAPTPTSPCPRRNSGHPPNPAPTGTAPTPTPAPAQPLPPG